MADDVCRASIVAPYVGKDLFGPLDVGSCLYWGFVALDRLRHRLTVPETFRMVDRWVAGVRTGGVRCFPPWAPMR